MIGRILLQAAVILVFFVASAFAGTDSVKIYNGDLRIYGSGNGLVFPDGSIQYKATLEGPPGPQGPAGPTNSLSIGTITTSGSGSQAAASITGAAPNQVLNLTIPQGTNAPPLSLTSICAAITAGGAQLPSFCPTILVGAPNKGSSYYGMYSQDAKAVSFTLSGSYYVSTIDIVLRTLAVTNFTTFNFSLQNALTGSITTYASASLTVPLGNSSPVVMSVNKILPAGTYYLVGIIPGYFGTPVTPGDVNGWFLSNGVYNNVTGTVTDGLWSYSGSTWNLSSGDYYHNGTMYYTPAFSVHGLPVI